MSRTMVPVLPILPFVSRLRMMWIKYNASNNILRNVKYSKPIRFLGNICKAYLPKTNPFGNIKAKCVLKYWKSVWGIPQDDLKIGNDRINSWWQMIESKWLMCKLCDEYLKKRLIITTQDCLTHASLWCSYVDDLFIMKSISFRTMDLMQG